MGMKSVQFTGGANSGLEDVEVDSDEDKTYTSSYDSADESIGSRNRAVGLKKFEESALFQNFMTAVILLNAFVLALEADNPGKSYWEIVDNIFLWVFVVELLVRLYVYGQEFFNGEHRGWNLFDFFIVIVGVVDQWIFTVIFGRGNEQMSNMVSTLRVVRLLRVLKLFKRYRQLDLLMVGLIGSVKSVFWVAIMFLILVFTTAIFVTNMVGHEADLFDDPEMIRHRFGTILDSMVTLFIYLTCDDWSTSARMVNKVHIWMEWVWILYIVMGAFLILSLLTGLMADKMKEARDLEAEQNESKPDEFAQVLDELKGWHKFSAIDNPRKHPLGKTPQIEEHDFEELVRQPKVKEALAKCGLKKMGEGERKWLFKSIDTDNSGNLSWDELTNAFLQISKHSSSVASPLEIMKLEGVLVRLDRTLSSLKKDREDGTVGWDHQLDQVHARASLLKARLRAIEAELQEFFQRVGYDAECNY